MGLKASICYLGLFLFMCNIGLTNASSYGFLVVNADGSNYRGGPAAYGPPAPPKSQKLSGQVVVGRPSHGCTPLVNNARDPKESIANKWVLLSYNYNDTCSNVTRTLNAQAAGALGVLLDGNIDEVWVVRGNASNYTNPSVSIPTVWLDRETGGALVGIAGTGSDVTVYQYKKTFLDFSYILIISIGIATLIAASIWSGWAMRSSLDQERKRRQIGIVQVDEGDEDDETPVVFLSAKFALVFIAVASTVLLLFFFFGKLVILAIILYCLGAFNGTWSIIYAACAHNFPHWSKPAIGPIPVLRVATAIPALILVIWWVIVRKASYAWVLQDILGCCFITFALRVVAFPDIKVATIFLVAAFVYDIFWVFISALIFKKSVMASVATSGGTGEAMPMVLKVPSFTDEFGAYSILGLGDIFIPGMLVAFLCRFDFVSKRGLRNGYFIVVTIGYSLALLVTVLAVKLMNRAQPALLYIVPFTLLPTVIWAHRRGDLKEMWEGPPESDQHVDLLERVETGSHGSGGDEEEMSLMAQASPPPPSLGNDAPARASDEDGRETSDLSEGEPGSNKI